ncbi:MAG: hypothetical protein F6K11_35180, partial [Leptolyngbya sp. SIO3F4]|nr:hypothetical protein [Leptolyngbya sp. SIO3F4]
MTRSDRTFANQPSAGSKQQSLQLQTRPFASTDAPKKTSLESAAKTNFNFGQVNLFASEAALPAFSPSPIQAKLTIGQPNDRYEQEADNVAKTEVQQINNPSINQQEHEVQRAPLI